MEYTGYVEPHRLTGYAKIDDKNASDSAANP